MTYLEAGWAPVNKLDSTLGLDASDSTLTVLWHDIATVQETASHVLALLGITLNHLVTLLEARVGHVENGILFVSNLLSREQRCESRKREVDTGVWDQVSLELVQIDVQGAVESEGGSDGRDDWNLSAENHAMGVRNVPCAMRRFRFS